MSVKIRTKKIVAQVMVRVDINQGEIISIIHFHNLTVMRQAISGHDFTYFTSFW